MTAQRYVIIKLLEQLKDGDEFFPDSYPLHITIVPSFQLENMDDYLLKKIKQLCANFDVFTVKAGDDEFFGPNKEVHVTTIRMDNELHRLHDSLVDVLSEASAIFDEPEYMLENYRAHATIQESHRLNDGDTVTIGSITIIDKLPSGNPGKRKLLKTLYFSKH